MPRFKKETYARSTYARMVQIKEWLARELESSLIREKELRVALLAMAKLAADTPQFDNPLVAWEAQKLRDEILARNA